MITSIILLWHIHLVFVSATSFLSLPLVGGEVLSAQLSTESSNEHVNIEFKGNGEQTFRKFIG